MAEPYPKSRQLERGERRYRRKVASPKQWAAIRAEKLGPCRICERLRAAGLELAPIEATMHIQLHHLVPRSMGGDDVAANMVPLCTLDHSRVTYKMAPALRSLAESLSDAEYAYVVGKLGEGAMGGCSVSSELRRRVLDESGLGEPVPYVSVEIAQLLTDLLLALEASEAERDEARRQLEESGEGGVMLAAQRDEARAVVAAQREALRAARAFVEAFDTDHIDWGTVVGHWIRIRDALAAPDAEGVSEPGERAGSHPHGAGRAEHHPPGSLTSPWSWLSPC